MKRRYELKERARRQEETRTRIVQAAVDLHTSIGPARTTVSAIAERAGVERHTFYAHFPDERTLFGACSTHWRNRHPRPDHARSLALERPEDRLRGVLLDQYAWYEEVEPELAVIIRDSTLVPVVGETLAEGAADMVAVAAGLSRDWPRRKPVRAAIGHALEFETWRSLVRRQGLTRTQAVAEMLRLVQTA